MRLGSRSSSPGTVNARAFSRWNVSHFYNTFQQHLRCKSMIYDAQLLTFPADEAAEEPNPSLSVSTLSSTAPGKSVASAARVSKTWMLLLLCIATTTHHMYIVYCISKLLVILGRVDVSKSVNNSILFKSGSNGNRMTMQTHKTRHQSYGKKS